VKLVMRYNTAAPYPTPARRAVANKIAKTAAIQAKTQEREVIHGDSFVTHKIRRSARFIEAPDIAGNRR
jgi:hypothetical protein